MFALSESVETATGNAVIRLGTATRPVGARRRVKTFETSRFGGRGGGFSRGRPGRRRRIALPSLRIASTLRLLWRRGGALRRSFAEARRRGKRGTKRTTAARPGPNNRRERLRRRRRDNARTPLRRTPERRRRSRNRDGATLPERLRRPTFRNARGTAKNAPRNRGRKGILGTSVDFLARKTASAKGARRERSRICGENGTRLGEKKARININDKTGETVGETALRTRRGVRGISALRTRKTSPPKRQRTV